MSRILSFRISKTLTPGILPNGTERRSPSLPILVKSEERGWDMFLSHHLHHGQAHHNYYIATEGEHAGKVGGKEQPRRRGASGRLVADQECLRPVSELRHPAVRSSTDRPLVQETSEPGSERVYRPDGNDYFLHTGRRHQRSRSAKKSTGRFPLIC